jgi:predicted aminopeptidase
LKSVTSDSGRRRCTVSRLGGLLTYALMYVLMGTLLGGCAQLGYYAQAAQGQYALWADAKPVADWLADPQVAPKLKARLEQAQLIRDFAVRELGLPDNGSYRRYAALRQPFVVWNVVATPELSIDALSWCFPIAGCVNYRGYYRQEQAQAYADMLRADGFDVQVAGVPAYSTLGWFDDPLLSTFIHYPDAELARLIFHELAHQILYVAGDTPFNEAFATAVEEAGVQRWITLQDEQATGARSMGETSIGHLSIGPTYQRYAARRQDFVALLYRHRQALAALYEEDISDQRKRDQKERIFGVLRDDYRVLKAGWGGYAGYDRWFAEPLSNAHLASVANYHDLLPAFRVLLAQQKTLPGFYAAVRSLAALPKPERDRILHR